MARKGYSLFAKVAAVLAALGAGVYLLKRDTSSSGCTEDALRKKVVDVARSEVGKKDLDRYFADAAPYAVGTHPEWCGIFALYCLHQAGLAKDKTWKVGLGFLETNPPLPKTKSPKPGDVAYFTKFQHQAVVLAVNDDGSLETANGNGTGGVVSVGHPHVSDAFAFYSISNLIDQAIAKGCA